MYRKTSKSPGMFSVTNSRIHRARAGHFIARLAALALLTATLAGCETTGFESRGSRAGEARAESLARNGQYAEAAEVYTNLAAQSSGRERDRLTLLAVEKWLDAGDAGRAASAFATVAPPPDAEIRRLWNTDAAALLLYRGDPDEALEILEPMSRESLSLRHRLRVEALRADAWIQLGDPTRAVQLMTQREIWLSSIQEVEQNRWRLWQGLIVSDPQTLRSAAEVALDRNVKGWLQLGSLAASTGQQGIGWANGALRWQNNFPDHPAMRIISRLQLPEQMILDYPRNVALLLPLSGRTAAAGRALQNGFMGAYFSAVTGLDDPQTIRVYDVNAEGGSTSAYSRAIQEGADFVIGPLLRNHVIELANNSLVPVPILTLNYLPEDSLPPPGLYQFALSPEDEARAAAERAIAEGHSQAVALVPSSDWGRRVLDSFSSEFEALGGTLLDYRRYTPSNPDFSNTIEELMALAGSIQRYERLRANIGGPLQFDPRRRQDAEFVFLAADAPAGRLLKSQLKFHYSGDLPVYSTSSIYALDGRSNVDLNGIRFPDAPWIIEPQHWLGQLPAMYRQYWPEERRLTRLHAMGYDAYQLVAGIFTIDLDGMPEIDGATGRLYLDVDGRVHRRLAWAQFRRGEAVALPDPELDDEPLLEPAGDPPDPQADTVDDESWATTTREL